MLYRLRATAPAVLVPLAWSFVTVAHLGAVTDRTLLASHVVMDVLLVAFVVLSWSDMTEGVLLAWKVVILAGIPVTLAGTAGLALSPPVAALLWIAVVGWMLIPAAGLVYTGLAADAGTTINLGAGVLSVIGTLAYVLGMLGAAGSPVAGLVLVGLGQTAGIVDAVVRY